MTPNPTTIEANRTVRDAAELLASGDVGAVVVVDDGEVLGIVTERDPDSTPADISAEEPNT